MIIVSSRIFAQQREDCNQNISLFLLVNYIYLNHITYDIVIILTVTIITQDFKFVFLGYRYGR